MKKLLGFVVAGLVLPLAIVVSLVPSSTSCTTSSPSAPGRAPPNATLFASIKINTIGDNRLSFIMLMGSNLESGWDPHAVGAGSIGVFQIQSPGFVHPDITVAQALNPSYSTNYMLPAYKQALTKVSSFLWTNNPMLAAETAIKGAERPADWYHIVRGVAVVQAAYDDSLKAMKSMSISTDFAGNLSLPVPASTSTAPAATPAPDPCLPQVNTAAASQGIKGKVIVAAGANDPGREVKPATMAFLATVAGIYGKPLILTTGTNHPYLTKSGNVSDHSSGQAGDFGMVANGGGSGLDSPVGDKIATACLIAGGMPAAQAAREAYSGGLWDLQHNGLKIQCIWKTYEDGNHHNHVHIGARALAPVASAPHPTRPSRSHTRKYIIPAALHTSPLRITGGQVMP